jgi:hypothetical protein
MAATPTSSSVRPFATGIRILPSENMSTRMHVRVINEHAYAYRKKRKKCVLTNAHRRKTKNFTHKYTGALNLFSFCRYVDDADTDFGIANTAVVMGAELNFTALHILLFGSEKLAGTHKLRFVQIASL